MASPWPLTFSSGERPWALWALLFILGQLTKSCAGLKEGFKQGQWQRHWDNSITISFIVVKKWNPLEYELISGCQLIHIFLYNSYILYQNPIFWKTYFSYIFLYFEHNSYMFWWIGCSDPQTHLFLIRTFTVLTWKAHTHTNLLISIKALKIIC